MEPTIQNNTLRSLLIFIVIGVVLLGAVILGVRWARSRSDQIANKNTSQVATTEKSPAEKKAEAERKAKEDQQKAQAQSQPQPTQSQSPDTSKQVAAAPAQPSPQQSQPQTSSTSTTMQSPTHVPSTGMGDIVLPIAAVAAAVFTAMTYVQSRRRLERAAR